MAINLPALPFDYDALEPFISESALTLHYDQFHRRCSENLNDSIRGTKFSEMPLREIVLSSDGDLFRSAALVWNHNFYWQCLKPESSSKPGKDLLTAIEKHYETFQNFQHEFESSALNNCGSGWTWLVKTASGDLKIVNTKDADTPIVDLNTNALLTIDVWEHAYFMDYNASRSAYVKRFWHYVNWSFVHKNFLTS